VSARLSERKVIVTGAAQGMGRAIAVQAAREGAAFITIADVKEEAGEETAELVRQQGAKALFVKTDLRDSRAIKAMIDATAENAGGIDVLVNNAGITDDAVAKGIETIETLTVDFH